jgi:hypothetical protein
MKGREDRLSATPVAAWLRPPDPPARFLLPQGLQVSFDPGPVLERSLSRLSAGTRSPWQPLGDWGS